MVIIVAKTDEEIKQAFAWLSENEGINTVVKSDEIRKQKKSEYDKQRYQERKNSTMKKVETNEEEREEKEEGSPLLPPFPSSPNTLLSYSPYNPPFPEEREEREEDIFGGAVGKRGELKSFGPHVMLSEEEYLRLQKDFGYEETLRMIQDMNNYIGEDPKLIAKYKKRNHNLTLRNWKNRDEKKNGKEKQKTTKELIDEMDWSGWDE